MNNTNLEINFCTCKSTAPDLPSLFGLQMIRVPFGLQTLTPEYLFSHDYKLARPGEWMEEDVVLNLSDITVVGIFSSLSEGFLVAPAARVPWDSTVALQQCRPHSHGPRR